MESQAPPTPPPTVEPATAIIEARAAETSAAPAEPGTERGFALDRASLDQIVRDEAAYEPDPIRAAIERADYDDAAVRALARAKLGLPLPPELVADLLVGVERMEVLFALARHAGAEALDPLLDLLRSRRFSDDAAGADQRCALAFVLWQLRRPELVRSVLVPRLRRLIRHPALPVRAMGLAGWLAAQIADPHLTAVFEEHYGRHLGQVIEMVGSRALELWSMPLGEILELLPERAVEQVFPGTPVRAAPKVGRNEPCPCGSGKKFKRCCADRPGAATVAAGPSRAEQLRALEPRLERDQIALLSRADLARLDLTRLRDGAVIDVMRRQAQLRDWRRACLAVDELARRRGRAFADEHLEDVIHEALHARHHEDARRLLERLDEDGVPSFRLEAALAAREPTALARLETYASVAVEGRDEVAVDLAHAALATMPELGLLLARGALRAGHEFDNEMLLEAIEEARDELGLPPGDPAQELFAALGGVHGKLRKAAEIAEERAGLARTAASLRADLDATTARLAAMQRQVADHQRELERAERAAAERAAAEAGRGAAPPAAEEQERRALRSKIEELQALIRERNEERGELRRQLSSATDHKPGAPAAAETPPLREREADGAEDEAEELPDAAASRPVQIPRFAAAATAALEVVPRNVAAGAMRRVGALAAGDPAAWRAVKQAKDMPRQVLMARIGIHHRLLFRVDGGLDVLDLVTRESLMTTLKRLRSI